MRASGSAWTQRERKTCLNSCGKTGALHGVHGGMRDNNCWLHNKKNDQEDLDNGRSEAVGLYSP